jgi:hypothetical protein
MKYVITLYIALGFVLSSALGIEYSCDGQDMFPEYTGSPFIFRQKSLGSSMTHYYSVWGLIGNIAIWTGVLLLIRLAILQLIERTRNNKMFNGIYKVIVGVLIVFTTLNVAINYIILGSGFGENSNYWYFDLDNNAKDWGVECKGKWGVFLIPE